MPGSSLEPPRVPVAANGVTPSCALCIHTESDTAPIPDLCTQCVCCSVTCCYHVARCGPFCFPGGLHTGTRVPSCLRSDSAALLQLEAHRVSFEVASFCFLQHRFCVRQRRGLRVATLPEHKRLPRNQGRAPCRIAPNGSRGGAYTASAVCSGVKQPKCESGE